MHLTIGPKDQTPPPAEERAVPSGGTMCGLTLPHCRALKVHWDNLGCQEGDPCSSCDFKWQKFDEGENTDAPWKVGNGRGDFLNKMTGELIYLSRQTARPRPGCGKIS